MNDLLLSENNYILFIYNCIIIVLPMFILMYTEETLTFRSVFTERN